MELPFAKPTADEISTEWIDLHLWLRIVSWNPGENYNLLVEVKSSRNVLKNVARKICAKYSEHKKVVNEAEEDQVATQNTEGNTSYKY